MPLYEYACADCQVSFEVLRSFGQADSPIACPRCQGQHTRKMISACATISKDSSGGSRLVSSSQASGGGCGGCSGGSCASCGH